MGLILGAAVLVVALNTYLVNTEKLCNEFNAVVLLLFLNPLFLLIEIAFAGNVLINSW